MVIAFIPLLFSQSPNLVSLQRQFVVGQKDSYSVTASVEEQVRGVLGVSGQQAVSQDTWLPSETDFNYSFQTRVLSVDANVAKMKFFMPKMTVLDDSSGGDTSDPKPREEKVNQTVLISLSNINEILDLKDLSPSKSFQRNSEKAATKGLGARRQVGSFFNSFISDLVRLCLFIAPIDSSIDLQPHFDVTPVKVGGTWTRTISFQPQSKKDASGNASTKVQRLDLNYVFQGLQQLNGKSLYEIDASAEFKSDFVDLLKDQYKVSTQDTHIQNFPLAFKTQMKYYVDPKTCQLIFGKADSVGGFSVQIQDLPKPIYESKFTGHTEIHLDHSEIVPQGAKG